MGRKVVLSVDDLIIPYRIPKFISASRTYADPSVSRMIHDMMVVADWIVVTTPTLADQLSDFYGIPRTKFKLFPNLPSFNWLGRWNWFNKRNAAFKEVSSGARKPRVGILSSLSHISKDGKVEDDLTIVEKAGLDDTTQLAFSLTESSELRSRFPHAEFHNMVQIRDYPSLVSSLNLDMVVVPLIENDFNDCKSNIKLIECAAMGIPVLVSKSRAYEAFIKPEMVFSTPEELKQKVVWVESWTPESHMKRVSEAYDLFFGRQYTHDYFGIGMDAWWAEANIPLILDTWTSPPMTGSIETPHIVEGMDE